MSSRNNILAMVIAACGLAACNGKGVPQQAVNERPDTAMAESADFRKYDQYLSCSIDGQPYLAYYEDGHTTGVVNTVNSPARVTFSTSADDVKVNGKTKLSELMINFYSLAQKTQGTLMSNNDFYIQGHTDFPEGGDLKYVSFVTKPGQQLTLSSVKDGMLEGAFSLDVADEHDPTHILHITDGNFRLRQGGKTGLHTDANGDVDMDSLMNSVHQ